jgi:predicted nucleic acid-binding protein
MVSKLIYLDTNLWNRLLDQNVNPNALLSRLEWHGSSLALSGQTVYELALTFQTSTERGKKLFRYLKVYVDAWIDF